jgi:hypothetical protein
VIVLAPHPFFPARDFEDVRGHRGERDHEGDFGYPDDAEVTSPDRLCCGVFDPCVAGLRELHDSIPIVKAFAELKFEEYDLATWAETDLSAATNYIIRQIKVSQAGGNTRAPAADRVEIIYHDAVDWDAA